MTGGTAPQPGAGQPGDRLRAAVIGCGVGSHHAYAYHHHPDVDLVAICDVNPAAFEGLVETARSALSASG